MTNQQTEVETRGTKGTLGNPSNSLTNLNVEKTFLFKASMSQKTVAHEESRKHTLRRQMEAWEGAMGNNQSPLGSRLNDQSDQSDQLVELVNKEAKALNPPHDKKSAIAKGKKILKCASPNTGTK